MVKTSTSELVSFDQDFHAWVLEQIDLLKSGRFADLDIEHLTDELRAVAMAERSEIRNRLPVLLQHLLKWEFQPERRSNSWRATILEQRTQINDIIDTSPSLRRYPATVMEKEYRIGRLRAADETGLPLDRLPSACPYSITQVLDENFFPGGRGGFED
jgi:Domain of unknown function DUF29